MIDPRPHRAFQVLICLVALLGARVAWADEAQRIWVLPFTQLHADPSVEHLREALPALLTMALSQSDGNVVVDRQLLDELLEELSLTWEGLIASDDRHRIGRLLGATVMITGSYKHQSGNLLVNVRATNLETGIVTATSSVSGPVGEPRELVEKLYRAAFLGLGTPSPNLDPDQIDRTPLSNLHFMKGLGHYFSARYSLAIAEFMLAADEEEFHDTAGLWLAKTYIADRQYGHAYLELIWLTRRESARFADRDIAARMRECERQLGADEVKRIRELAVRRAPAKRSGDGSRSSSTCTSMPCR